MLVTTAQSAHCQRSTNCSRESCTEDCIHDSTKNKRKTSRSSYQTTDHLATYIQIDWTEMPRVWNQKVDSDSWVHEDVRFHHSQVNFLTSSNRATSITITSGSWRRYTETKRHLYRPTKRATRKEPNVMISLSSLRIYRIHKTTSSAGKRNDNPSEWQRPWLSHESEDLPTTCFCSHSLKNSFKTCCANSREVLKKVGLRIHPEKTKIVSNQSSLSSDKKKKWKSMTLISKYWQEEKAWDTCVRRIRSRNRRRPKSRIESGLLGRHSTSKSRSWHRKTTCSNIVSDCSTQQ